MQYVRFNQSVKIRSGFHSLRPIEQEVAHDTQSKDCLSHRTRSCESTKLHNNLNKCINNRIYKIICFRLTYNVTIALHLESFIYISNYMASNAITG